MNDAKTLEMLVFVMQRYVRRTIEGQQIRLSIQLSEQQIQGLLMFLVEGGKSPEQAVSLIKEAQQRALNMGPNVEEGFPWKALAAPAAIIALLLACVWLRDLPLWTVLIAIVLSAAFVFLIWSPRKRAMEDVWRKNRMYSPEEFVKNLPLLAETTSMPLMKLLFGRQLLGTLLIVVAPVVGCVVMACAMLMSGMAAEAYHQAMIAQGNLRSMSGSEGTRFTVYDMDEGRYVREYLTDDSLFAKTADDVRGVLIVDMTTKRVGYYGNDMRDGAYQYIAEIRLYDCKTGQMLDTVKRVEGSDPPSSVRSNVMTGAHNAYGFKPSDAEIGRACGQLIALLGK